jgi:hypothetical protein
VRIFLFCLLFLAVSGIAQESSPAPSSPSLAAPTVIISAAPSTTATPAAIPAPSAIPAASPAPSASPTPSLLKKTGVKLQFLPPPMEGTISLGIYDHTGKLVRILHREATGDEFVAALDGYITHWDGLDDAGKTLAPGHYGASGYMVGAVTVTTVHPLASGTSAIAAASPPQIAPSSDTLAAALPSLKFPNGKPFVPQDKIHAGLVPNPLEQDRIGSAVLAAGFNAKGSWIQLADGLPLKQISATPNLKWVALGRSAPGEPLVFFQSDGATLEEFLITKISNMMAFDCGGFDFTGPGK